MPRKLRANANKYKTFAYKKHAGNIEACLKGTGYLLDHELSDLEHQLFYNPAAKKAVMSFRGTDVRDPK